MVSARLMRGLLSMTMAKDTFVVVGIFGPVAVGPVAVPPVADRTASSFVLRAKSYRSGACGTGREAWWW